MTDPLPARLAAHWQPIATAPKDEDVLLLYRDGYGVQPGYWDRALGWLSVETQGLTGGLMEPTHWMPLPEPPLAALLVGVEPPQTTRSVENSRLRNLAAELRAAGETTNRDVKRLEAFCEMVGGEPPAIAATFTAWHEDDGPVLWWEFPISEPPYAGTPLDSDWPFTEACYPSLGWTRLDIPQRKLDD